MSQLKMNSYYFFDTRKMKSVEYIFKNS